MQEIWYENRELLSGEVQRTPTIFMISVGWGIGWGIRIVETDRIQ